MASFRCLVARLALSAALLGACAKPPAASVAWVETHRSEMAQAFARQAASCAARSDTANPSFHGCVDWHSAVHAAWALTAYQRITGDAKYAAFVDKELSPKNLTAEMAHLRKDRDFEMPYGRAWVLRLAVERKQAGGDDRLDKLAGLIAASLRDHYASAAPDPLAISYDNPSWALLNLLAYARAYHDPSLEALVTKIVRERFLTVRCPLLAEESGFIAVCTTWAWLVSEALPAPEFRKWYAAWNPGLDSLAPVENFTEAHDYGRNFSRAWGLYHLANVMNDDRLREAYARHVRAGYEPKTRWRGEYLVNGHWVAQFGMLAIEPLFGADR